MCKTGCLEDERLRMIARVATPVRLPVSRAAAPIVDLPSSEHRRHCYSSTRSQAAAPCSFGCCDWPFLHHSQQHLEMQRLGCWPSNCILQLLLTTTSFKMREQRLEGHFLRHLCYTGRVKGRQEPLEASFNLGSAPSDYLCLRPASHHRCEELAVE